jgi:hypothetical protein
LADSRGVKVIHAGKTGGFTTHTTGYTMKLQSIVTAISQA